jgi:hypothetical protein
MRGSALYRRIACAAAYAAVASAMPVQGQSVNPFPDSGSAVAGVASTPIANVAANDTVNVQPATLGAGANATVAPAGVWPSGITLDSAADAVSTSAALAAGTYNFPYQLCDLAAPPHCATTTDTITVSAASIVALADSGNADAGIASRPIANVAANDTVNGAPAVLGPSGNATVAKVTPWPAGITLTTSTGAVSTTASVPTGTYNIAYQLCDLTAPPDCATTTDTVAVGTASIVAVADAGSADAGVASKPIANVAANDTVNGAPVTLGTSGNATIAKVGTWPTAITLNTSTGAVTTTAAVPAGNYSIQYRLCDKNVPAACATTTDSVALITASIVAVADSGSADAGSASRPIANVAANDTVNAAPVVLGTSGNATIAKVSTWPAGIALTAATGAVSTSAAVPAGTYSIQYRLCDKNVPPSCTTATDTITVMAVILSAGMDSGSADFGIASKPIANVAANDTVNGAPVVLGTSGNATITKVGTWPAGIALNTSTGVVTTAASVPAGTYNISYRLCDLNAPPVCTTATDTVTVIVAAIVAVADSGSAVSGTASTPIANVGANDTVNGAPAALGILGNAALAKVGAWPAGVGFDTSTGAVSTTATVAPGTYNIPYRLCDKNTPPACATATDTVTVTAASIMALPDTGNAVAGTASTPIANVDANDTVNGAPAMLGMSGNATVAQVGTWPAGIGLDTSSGAVTITASVPAGTYSITYQLCDLTAPPDCATATDTVTVASAFAEVQATAVALHDIEFDWGRDGIFCATCNYGQSNARYNWTDPNGNLWVGHLDPNSGAFTPPAGNNELADNTAFYYAIFNNGPEWAFSTQNGQVISQLVYTRYPPGTAAVPANAGVAFATPGPGGWSANFFPGAMGATGGGAPVNSVMPEASQCNTDPVALTEFIDLATPQDVFGEPTTTAPGTAPTLMPFGSYASDVSGDKPAVRWVPCTHQLVFIGAAPPDGSGDVYYQVFWYNFDTQAVQQLTLDGTDHAEGFMFQAPEFNGAYVFYTISNNVEIDVYEQTGVGSNGAPTFQLVNQITSPDPAEPYISGTEPFINCTPTCQTYIFMKVQSTLRTASNINSIPNGLAVTNINPAQPLFKILVPEASTPTIQRNDAEYYITANGPYLYYSRNVITSATTQFQAQGRYFIDMQLGAPTGVCVGSSAEGGLLPGC